MPSQNCESRIDNTAFAIAAKNLWAARFVPLLLTATILTGCQEAPANNKQEVKNPSVTVAYPIESNVVDYEEFTGRVDAVNKVGVQAMVTGYLQEIKFKDGAEVKKDDVLFEIDPKIFQAAANRSKASLDLAKAHYDRLQRDYERGKQLMRSKAMSEEDFQRIEGDLMEAKASIGMAEAQFEQDSVNLEYTKVRSPITGKVSRRLIDRGNMVKANETMLTWVYQIDQMYGYFDVDERTCIHIRKLINDGKIKSYRDGSTDVDVGLADEEGYSMKGNVDWVDNVLDSGTGTLKVRSVIQQPRDKSGNPLILVSPGMFVRIKFPTSLPRQTLLIAEKAIGTDQGEKYVFIANEKNEIERRNLTLGQMQTVIAGQVQYTLRVVEKNSASKGKDLSISDKVVIGGLQRVHTGSVVEPTLAVMPGGTPARGLFADQTGLTGNGKGRQ